MKPYKVAVFIGAVLFAGFVLAQNTVTANQGQPGKQGPWPVTLQGPADGGSGYVFVVDRQCLPSSPYATTAVSTSATSVPASAQAGRLYVQVCNSLENSSNPTVKCRSDGVNPINGIGNPGDVFGVGDCKNYPIQATNPDAGNTIRCIATAASTAVTTFECIPTP